ncbi:MAG: extracellular solute-binding protein [Ardenticatenales bacterium]|nr:extracellular solute-binding protein [Ardenticatenales bacterium]
MSKFPEGPHYPSSLSRRQLLKLGAAFGLSSVVLGGCAPTSQGTMVDPKTLLESSASIPIDILVEQAKKEGVISTISLTRDWANYGEIIDSFTQKYGIEYNGLHTDYDSAQEVEEIRKTKDTGGEQAPDVVDIGIGLTQAGKEEGLFAPYKVSTWDTIPDNLKDPEGHWYGDYYGVLTFVVSRTNVKNVPQDWADLLKPEYKGTIALGGNPLHSSVATNTIWAAGLSRTGSLDTAPEAGIEFFKELHQSGNFLPLTEDDPIVTMESGATPIVLHWDYIGLTLRDQLEGNVDVEIVVPQSGILGGTYAQAISAYAPHPFAARLWVEYLYSDEAQLMWLKGYAHPIRYNDLVRRGVVPEELAAKLPPAKSYEKALFPTVDQITKAVEYIRENWHRVIASE